jgi:hypothetical protein
MPKHVGVKFESINKKIHYFLEHLLVFLQTILQAALFNHQYSEDIKAGHVSIQYWKNVQLL